MTMSRKILQFIGMTDGKRYSEIQRFIVEDIKGLEFNRSRRGYWSTNLYILLNAWCWKGTDGRWRAYGPIPTKGFFSSIAKRTADQSLYLRSARKVIKKYKEKYVQENVMLRDENHRLKCHTLYINQKLREILETRL